MFTNFFQYKLLCSFLLLVVCSLDSINGLNFQQSLLPITFMLYLNILKATHLAACHSKKTLLNGYGHIELIYCSTVVKKSLIVKLIFQLKIN